MCISQIERKTTGNEVLTSKINLLKDAAVNIHRITTEEDLEVEADMNKATVVGIKEAVTNISKRRNGNKNRVVVREMIGNSRIHGDDKDNRKIRVEVVEHGVTLLVKAGTLRTILVKIGILRTALAKAGTVIKHQ